jgi:orotate phosphoribosyltransferase
VLLLEDVVTTGGAALASIEALRRRRQVLGAVS